MLFAQLVLGFVGIGATSAAFIRFGLTRRLVFTAAAVAVVTGVMGTVATGTTEIRNAAALPREYDAWYAVLATCACLIAVLSIIYGFQNFRLSERVAPSEIRTKAILLAFWVIVPPVWFTVDYFIFFNHSRLSAGTDVFERFKYGQDLASKTWLALVTLLTGLYFGKDFSPSQSRDDGATTGPPAVEPQQQTAAAHTVGGGAGVIRGQHTSDRQS